MGDDRIAGAAGGTAGAAEDATRGRGADLKGEVARLHGEIERLLREPAPPPARAGAAGDYTRRAGSAAAGAVREHPLLAAGLALAACLLLGRLVAGGATSARSRR